MVSYADDHSAEIAPAVWVVGEAPSRPAARWDLDNNEIVLSITFGSDSDVWWAEGIRVYIVDLTDAGDDNINLNMHGRESNAPDVSVEYGEADYGSVYFEAPRKQLFEGDLEILIKDTPDVDQTEIFNI
jgi:hypothetical protein